MIVRSVAAFLLLTVLATGAAARDGAALFEPCRACHALDPAAKPMAGPNLAGLIGRKVAGDEQFDYSPVLREAREQGRVWSAATLEQFIAEPEKMFPGTWMSRVPIASAADRQALLRFITDPASR
jgi:cytochrome c